MTGVAGLCETSADALLGEPVEPVDEADEADPEGAVVLDDEPGGDEDHESPAQGT